MKKDVSISMTKYYDRALIYFDVDEVCDANRVESAYLLLELDRYKEAEPTGCYLNDKIDLLPINRIKSEISNRCNHSFERGFLIDITESFHLITSGAVKNQGIIIELPNNNLFSCRMQLVFRDEIILPSFSCMGFYEKQLLISSDCGKAVSPCFLTASSSTITFCVCNESSHPVSVRMQYSPDAQLFVNDVQNLILQPKETELLIPYKFIKYTRIVVSSIHESIVTKLWYQTQLIH